MSCSKQSGESYSLESYLEPLCISDVKVLGNRLLMDSVSLLVDRGKETLFTELLDFIQNHLKLRPKISYLVLDQPSNQFLLDFIDNIEYAFTSESFKELSLTGTYLGNLYISALRNLKFKTIFNSLVSNKLRVLHSIVTGELAVLNSLLLRGCVTDRLVVNAEKANVNIESTHLSSCEVSNCNTLTIDSSQSQIDNTPTTGNLMINNVRVLDLTKYNNLYKQPLLLNFNEVKSVKITNFYGIRSNQNYLEVDSVEVTNHFRIEKNSYKTYITHFVSNELIYKGVTYKKGDTLPEEATLLSKLIILV